MSVKAISVIFSACVASGVPVQAASSIQISYLNRDSQLHAKSADVVDHYIDTVLAESQKVASRDRKKIAAFRARLGEYKTLQAGWDGEVGAVPDLVLIDNLSVLFEEIVLSGFAVPDPAISSDGEIGLYWRKNGIFAEVTIDGPGEYSYFAKTKDGRNFFAEELTVASGIHQDLKSLIDRLSPRKQKTQVGVVKKRAALDSFLDDKTFPEREGSGSFFDGGLFLDMEMYSPGLACR
jgi:hypothetical protein